MTVTRVPAHNPLLATYSMRKIGEAIVRTRVVNFQEGRLKVWADYNVFDDKFRYVVECGLHYTHFSKTYFPGEEFLADPYKRELIQETTLASAKNLGYLLKR